MTTTCRDCGQPITKHLDWCEKLLGHARPKVTEQGLLDQFLLSVLVFVDRNGKVVDKHSTSMSCSLKMEYDKDDLAITMHVYSHGMGNGSCGATITYEGKLVYDAGGTYTATPHNVKVKTYKSGRWEKLIPKYEKRR